MNTPDVSVRMDKPCSRPRFRKTCGLFLLSLFSLPAARAVLPVLPPGDNTENIVFMDDFDYNSANANVNAPFKGWSNIVSSPATGKAIIGSDPADSAVTAWYPGVTDGTPVSSSLTLPVDLNLADGPIALYMRVRVDGGSSSDGNRFSITLTEKTPNNRLGSLTIRPGNTSSIGYRNAAGAGQPATPNGSSYTFPAGASSYQDFRLVLSKTSPAANPPGDYLKLDAYYYNATTNAYVSLGGVTGANIQTGIFNQLQIYSRNGAMVGGVTYRAFFDSVVVTQTGSPRASCPSNATYLPATATVTDIQNALNAVPHVVVLAKANYGTAGTITMNSGYRLYGDQSNAGGVPGTTIPPVTVTAGATGVVLSHLQIGHSASGITFPASATPTTGNVSEHLGAKVAGTGATLRDNLFLNVAGVFAFDTSAGGDMRNNRFIRCRSQSNQVNVTLLGEPGAGAAPNKTWQSYGNVFLWYNFLTPWGDATKIGNQGDLTFVGIDGESWNYNNQGSSSGTTAFMKATEMGTLRVFSPNGGNHGAYRTPDFDVDAQEFQLYNERMEMSLWPVIGTAGAGTLRNNFGGTLGSKFTVGAADITVTELGCYDDSGANGLPNGNATTHQVGLWTEAGALLGSVTVQAGTASALSGEYRYAALASPITLTAGQTYRLGVYMTNGGVDKFRDPASPAPIFNTGLVTANASVYVAGAGLAFPSTVNSTAQTGYVGPNMKAYLIDNRLGSHNVRSLRVNTHVANKYWASLATNPTRFDLFNGIGASAFNTSTTSTSGSTWVTPVWTPSTGALGAGQQTTLTSMLVNPARTGLPWESPRHSPIPDPAGPNWATSPVPANQPDDAPMIQNLLDTSADGMARLPAGTYYIGSPLRIANGHGIIGAGADRTVIIAKSTTIDMIVANDATETLTGRSITVADITLQGGKNGIHLEPIGVGTATGFNGATGQWILRVPAVSAQYRFSYINHVTFRNMSEAGLFMDQIYALDNIFFGYVHFVNCDIGLKQKVDPTYVSGETSTMMYMDKCVFYKCQFAGNRIALDLPGKRGSNLNAWISCLFKNNTGASASYGVANMSAYVTPLFANCDFINNGGSTAGLSNNYTISVVGCGFSAGANDVAMLGGPVSIEGSTFSKGTNSTVRMIRSSTNTVCVQNCTSDIPLWTATPNTNKAVFINNLLVSADNVNKYVVTLSGATQYDHVPTATTVVPTQQLLFGSDWTVSPVLPLLSDN